MTIGAFRLNELAALTANPSLALSFVTSASVLNSLGTVTTPSFTANIGDIIILVVSGNNSGTSAAPPTLVIPSGFSVWYNLATPTQASAQRTTMFYQISTTSGSRTLSSFGGSSGGSYTVFVYRPNLTLTKVSFTTGSSEITTAAPSNQTLTFGTMTAATVAFAYGANTNSSPTATNVLGSTVTPTTTVTTEFSGSLYSRLMSFEGAGFSGTSTISKTDVGTNSMFSTVMTATDQVARTTTATWAMAAGSMAYSTSTQKFGSANANFSGTSRWARLTVNPLDSGFYFNSDQTWTVEFWQRNGNTFLNNGQGQIFCIGDDIQAGSGQGSSGAMSITEGRAFNTSKEAFIGSTGITITNNGTADVAVHKHYAFVCYGNGTASLFVDGSVRHNRVAFSSTLNSRIITMGQGSTSNTQATSWIFDEMRVSNIARYNASFSVATAAFTNNANTLALMHFDSNTTDDTA
jgi:hypothetical protein